MTLGVAPVAAVAAAEPKAPKKAKAKPEDRGRLIRRAISTSGVKKLARANGIKRDSEGVTIAFREIARVFCQEVVRIQCDSTSHAKRLFVNEKDAASALDTINDSLMISPTLSC